MVMMRHLQDNHPNQIFVSASSDDLSLPAATEWQWSRACAEKQGRQLGKGKNPPPACSSRALFPCHYHTLLPVAAYTLKAISSLPLHEKRESNLLKAWAQNLPHSAIYTADKLVEIVFLDLYGTLCKGYWLPKALRAYQYVIFLLR